MLDIAKIKSRREKLGITQTDAAAKAGMSRQRWNDIESGRKTNIELETLDAIAKVLECKPKDLLK
jgi:DNA-binding Xre family transcriptional regulator